MGYKNKYGNPLTEDGLVGSNTLYAAENLNKDNVVPIVEQLSYLTSTTETPLTNALQRYREKGSLPVRTGNRPETTTSNPDKNPQETQQFKNNTYINENGIEKWRELPYIAQRLPIETQLFRQGKISAELYNAFDILSQRWYYSDTQEARDEIEFWSQKARDNNYKIDDYTELANKQLWENGQKMLRDTKSLRKTVQDLAKDPNNIFKKTKVIEEIGKDLLKLAIKGATWYFDVKPEGDWDYKSNTSEADWIPVEEYFLYHGQFITAADFGNINYGYTGTILGLNPETLYKAGGKVAPNPTKYEIDHYYSDSEVDHYWIKKGIEQANNQGYTGTIDLPVDLIFELL